MFRKLSTLLASAALVTAAPAVAQAAPAPAPSAESLSLDEGSGLFGGGGDYLVGYILLAAVLAGAIFAIIEFNKDDDSDFPVSP